MNRIRIFLVNIFFIASFSGILYAVEIPDIKMKMPKMKKSKMKVSFGQKINKNIRLIPGVGYNKPMAGYDDYANNLVFSLKLDVVRNKGFKRFPLSYGVNIDYFMMNVPKGTYGITEDLIDVTGGFSYGLLKNAGSFYPFFGIGLGLYIDWVRINTSNLDSSKMYLSFGFNGSLGFEMNITKSFLLIPDVTYHYSLGSKSANLAGMLRIAYSPKTLIRKKYNIRKIGK